MCILSVCREETITCTAATGIANARARAKALWQLLKGLIKAGKFAAVQARELWSTEELIHMRPGHFWALELGDADGLGSPVLAGPFDKQIWWPPMENEPGWSDAYKGIERQRYDAGDFVLLVRCYYHRVADDPEGLTFVREPVKKGVQLVISSSELRAVQGRQQCDFKLVLPAGAPKPREQLSRGTKRKASSGAEAEFNPKQRWRLDRELDVETRRVCE